MPATPGFIVFALQQRHYARAAAENTPRHPHDNDEVDGLSSHNSAPARKKSIVPDLLACALLAALAIPMGVSLLIP